MDGGRENGDWDEDDEIGSGEREKKSFSVSERLSASERGNEIDTETGGQRWIERTKDREKKRQSDREIESNTD